jgi:transcriptional regulator with XRE-family HTH domain
LALQQGDRELRRTAFRFGEDYRELRLRFGVSQRAVAIAIDVERSVITRLERGDPSVSPAIRARACAVLGADFRMQLYPERASLIYDLAHARIVERVVAMAGSGWRVEPESPLPGRRSVDLCLWSPLCVVLIEVETRIRRLEEIQRELHAKRDAIVARFGSERCIHVVLALPPTHHHRALLRAHPALVTAMFPVPSAQIRRALADPGQPFPGDGILWVAGSATPG